MYCICTHTTILGAKISFFVYFSSPSLVWNGSDGIIDSSPQVTNFLLCLPPRSPCPHVPPDASVIQGFSSLRFFVR